MHARRSFDYFNHVGGVCDNTFESFVVVILIESYAWDVCDSSSASWLYFIIIMKII